MYGINETIPYPLPPQLIDWWAWKLILSSSCFKFIDHSCSYFENHKNNFCSSARPECFPGQERQGVTGLVNCSGSRRSVRETRVQIKDTISYRSLACMQEWEASTFTSSLEKVPDCSCSSQSKFWHLQFSENCQLCKSGTCMQRIPAASPLGHEPWVFAGTNSITGASQTLKEP